jgi:hypothetical protein
VNFTIFGGFKKMSHLPSEFMGSRNSEAVRGKRKRQREEIERIQNRELRTGNWTKEEEDLLQEGIDLYGRDECSNEKIAEFMRSRTSDQVRKKISNSQEERQCCICRRIGDVEIHKIFCCG